ncbi:MAG: endonuclease domain-containing protein [Alphaproteobacteria bacterium]|nr:endonuclease domain-containing protein [Alphaproteobacteria bacterium]
MRSNPTVAERTLWQILRRKRFGVRFRRQQPIGPFVVDFYCAPAKLVIELDGNHHLSPEESSYDERRSRWLQSQGYAVIRFENSGVLNYEEAVIERIMAALEQRGVTVSAGKGRNRECDFRVG